MPRTASKRTVRRTRHIEAQPALRIPAEHDEPMTEAPVSRPEMRPAMRDDDPRARAAARTAQLRDHLGDLDEGVDKFYVPPEDVPDGWEYEWKRLSVYGKEDPGYQVQTARTGWEAVPVSRHPNYMPASGGHKIIERDGLILMERPKEISDEVRRIERRKANAQMRQKEEQLNATPEGHLPRDEDPRTRAVLKKTYEHVPIPK